MTAKLSIRDRGMEELRRNLGALGRIRVEAGVQPPKSERTYPDDARVTVGHVAAWMEYGTDDGHVPARPFLRHTAETSVGEARELLRKVVSDVVDGRGTPVDGLERVGRFYRDAIVDTIDRARSWAKPLAQSTVERKGHDAPLRETDLLRESITYAVVDGDTVLRQG